jgi:hypothetical protein
LPRCAFSPSGFLPFHRATTMLKLTPDPTFTANVPLTVPGREQPVTIQMEFKYVAGEESLKLFDEIATKTNVEAILMFTTGWKKVDAPFSPEALGKLLDNYPNASTEIFAAYQKNLLESRVKN